MKIRTVPISELTPHPLNHRQGDVGAISQSIEAHGVYKPLVTQLSTGFVIAGNQTLKAMQALGHTKAAVIEHDCDDDEAIEILLVDNRMSDLATYDDEGHAEVLRVLAEKGKLAGTGYDGEDVDRMLADIRRREADPAPVEQKLRTCPECGHEW